MIIRCSRNSKKIFEIIYDANINHISREPFSRKDFADQSTVIIDNDTLRIGVAVRVGLTACIPHRCNCGTTVDIFGTHPLSCRFSAGRIPRHSALNDVVRRGLPAAGIPSILEPSGLDRGDGKRPDGITVYPYSHGRCLIWDATCVNTFASSNLIRAAVVAGSVADAAEVRKIAKYAELGRRFIFQPVAVETSGAMGKSSIQFF